MDETIIRATVVGESFIAEMLDPKLFTRPGVYIGITNKGRINKRYIYSSNLLAAFNHPLIVRALKGIEFELEAFIYIINLDKSVALVDTEMLISANEY